MIANYRQAVQVAEPPEPEINFVEYIQSSGTQYIDTGFKPNNNTRVVIDMQLTKAGTYGIFGGRQAYKNKAFAFWVMDADEWKTDFGNGELRISSANTLSRVIIDKNKNVCYVGSSSYTNTSTSFESPSSLTLFAVKDGDGSVDDRMGSLKLYSCQIYDNEDLVRDYAPALDLEGVPCLYEKLSEQYVYNAGSGSFTAGPTISGEGDTNTLLLLHGEDISDSSVNNVSIQNYGVVSSDARSKFGGKSLYFDGSSYLSILGFPFPSGSSDFTVEWWQYMTSSDIVYNAGVVSIPFVETGGYGILVGYWATGHSNMTTYLSTTNNTYDVAEGVELGSVTFGTWQHYALVKSGSKYMVFNNGNKVVEKTNSNSIDPFSGSLFIGAYNYDSSWARKIKGYIDELRISNVARWTSNFTPPTAPYES